MEIVNKEVVEFGQTAVDVFRESGDLYDHWEIGDNPDATYGSLRGDRVPVPREGEVVELWITYDHNGWTTREVELFVNKMVVASAWR